MPNKCVATHMAPIFGLWFILLNLARKWGRKGATKEDLWWWEPVSGSLMANIFVNYLALVEHKPRTCTSGKGKLLMPLANTSTSTTTTYLVFVSYHSPLLITRPEPLEVIYLNVINALFNLLKFVHVVASDPSVWCGVLRKFGVSYEMKLKHHRHHWGY